MDSVPWFAPSADPINPLDPPDPVKRPAHFTSHPSGVECKTIVGHMNFNLGNAVKYIWRFSSGVDPKIQDLHKAIQYLEFEIERLGTNHGN